MSFQRTVENINKDFEMEGKALKGSIGAPIYRVNRLVGLNYGTEDTNGKFIAGDITPIAEYIKKYFLSSKFSKAEEVSAKWTDGFFYNARILAESEIGYRVDFYEFDHQHHDCSLVNIQKKNLPIPTTDESAPAPDSQTSSTFVNPQSMEKTPDSDDITLILSLWKKKRTVETIAKKFGFSESQIRQVIESEVIESEGQRSDNFDEEKFKQFSRWLKDLKLDQYIENCRENNIDSTDVFKGMKKEDIDAKLRNIGFKAGSIMKIQNALDAQGVYTLTGIDFDEDNMIHRTIKEISNDPMSQDWEPEEGQHLDLTEFYKNEHPNKICSVSFTTDCISNGKLPEQIGPNKENTFYIKSKSYKRYFKLTVKWVD